MNMRGTETGSELEVKWYYKPIWVIIAILALGPLALPLVWLSPAFKKWLKVTISILVLVLTALFVKASVDLYNILSSQIKELYKVLGM